MRVSGCGRGSSTGVGAGNARLLREVRNVVESASETRISCISCALVREGHSKLLGLRRGKAG